LQAFVNSDLRQNSNTTDLWFGAPGIVAFISQETSIDKGTVIMTNTPVGVAVGMNPVPDYLRGGDVVKVEVGNLAITMNRVVLG